MSGSGENQVEPAAECVPRRRWRSRTIRLVVLIVVGLLVVLAASVLANPPVTGYDGTENDRSPAANLTNGLTEAVAQYAANGQSYAAITPVLLNKTAPEFEWISDGPLVGPGIPSDALAVDPCADGAPCQAFLLAAYDRLDHECLYALTLSAVPADGLGLPTTGGTSYGLTPDPRTCSAGTPGHPSRPASGWRTGMSQAGFPIGASDAPSTAG